MNVGRIYIFKVCPILFGTLTTCFNMFSDILFILGDELGLSNVIFLVHQEHLDVFNLALYVCSS